MITGITHAAFYVTDMQKSVEFYCRVLGLKEAFELKDANGNPWIKYLLAGKNQFVELFYNKPEGSYKGSFSHLCFEVVEIEKLCERLGSTIRHGSDGNLQCWTKDPDGNPIELMQLSPDSLQSQAIRNA